ncbi:hypothetical protein ACFYRC_11200 [Streptomyces sp. NPDC005279]|uniref:hypothetical protein n=1 Tax=Streptomyces sp. NPDC005279 TaxID=3364712 RepID=UPI0036A485BE
MLHAPTHERVGIVCIGAFNPRIFQPAWFASQGLIAADEAVEVDVQMINNDVCVFSTDWFRLEVLDNRWSITSLSTPVFEILRDLALGTFSALHHTPIERVGLNSNAHFEMPNQHAYEQFGHELAPKETYWEPILSDPRTISLTVASERSDKHQGHVKIRVEPSAEITLGVHLEVNDEFHCPPGSSSSEWFVKLLTGDWDPHRTRVQQIQSNIIDKAWEL